MSFPAHVTTDNAPFLHEDGRNLTIAKGTAITVLDVFDEFSNVSAPIGDGTMQTDDYTPDP
jgi:hypothetical protein